MSTKQLVMLCGSRLLQYMLMFVQRETQDQSEVGHGMSVDARTGVARAAAEVIALAHRSKSLRRMIDSLVEVHGDHDLHIRAA